MIFEGISPNGLSVFCLAGTTAKEIMEEPAVDEVPVMEDKPAVEEQPADKENLPEIEEATVIDDEPLVADEDHSVVSCGGMIWWGWLVIGIAGSAIIAAMYLYWKKQQLSL
ncbi:MAG: hypothetical protein JW712_03650 [Dehalococcoidales bacterium]|nr:hypothetical protein [Dehalococcoidales bacterium]